MATTNAKLPDGWQVLDAVTGKDLRPFIRARLHALRAEYPEARIIHIARGGLLVHCVVAPEAA